MAPGVISEPATTDSEDLRPRIGGSILIATGMPGAVVGVILIVDFARRSGGSFAGFSLVHGVLSLALGALALVLGIAALRSSGRVRTMAIAYAGIAAVVTGWAALGDNFVILPFLSFLLFWPSPLTWDDVRPIAALLSLAYLVVATLFATARRGGLLR